MIQTLNDLVTFTIFGSAIWFLILASILAISLFVSEYQEEGGIAFTSILIFVIVNKIWGNIPLVELVTWANVVGYLLIGFIYSLIRTYFKGKELSDEKKKYFQLKDHVFRWWLMFPISMLYWLFGSLLSDLFRGVYSKLEFLYNKIYNL